MLIHVVLQQTQIPDYAELVVKFLDALIDTYLPGIEEEGGEESQRTPTSPYPPVVQSQLSITANLNLSNSMTSLATSQHSPGQDLHMHVYTELFFVCVYIWDCFIICFMHVCASSASLT